MAVCWVELSTELCNDCLPAFIANKRVPLDLGFIRLLRSILSLLKSFAHSSGSFAGFEEKVANVSFGSFVFRPPERGQQYLE